MPFYDDAIREVYAIPTAAFGATTDSMNIIGPKGKRGLVRDIEVAITTAMVGTTTVPEVRVGNAASDFSYARFRLGTAAGTGYGTGPQRASQVGGNTVQDGSNTFEDFPGHVVLGSTAASATIIPADTNAVITRQAGTGGTPAGAGVVRVTIEWF